MHRLRSCNLAILEFWNLGILESCNLGILESWTPGLLESWNPAILESRCLGVQVGWGQLSIVDAERRLLAWALLDLKNSFFVILSEK